MRLLVVAARRPGGRPLDQRAHPAGGAGEQCRVEAAVRDGLDQLRVARVVGPWHGQVKAGGDGGDPVGDRAPVGDDDAVEAPLVPQHLR